MFTYVNIAEENINDTSIEQVDLPFHSIVPGVPKKVYSSFLGKDEINVY